MDATSSTTDARSARKRLADGPTTKRCDGSFRSSTATPRRGASDAHAEDVMPCTRLARPRRGPCAPLASKTYVPASVAEGFWPKSFPYPQTSRANCVFARIDQSNT